MTTKTKHKIYRVLSFSETTPQGHSAAGRIGEINTYIQVLDGFSFQC
jgi:hypothetical protein